MARTSTRLDSKLHRAFRLLANEGFKQYDITKADLADQAKASRSKADLLYERSGVQRQRSGDALVGKTRTQVRRFVENALSPSRPLSAESARLVIWRIVNCQKACAWRKAWPDGSDPWLKKVLRLSQDGAPYVRGRLAAGEAPIRAFIHPKGVPMFVEQTLNDVGSCIPNRLYSSVKEAMIRSIEARARDRARAMFLWVAQSEDFVDVRVYEGPMYDPATGATVQTSQVRYQRVKPLDERRALDANEREPKAYERLRAIMADALDDSGQSTCIVDFVKGPFKATAFREGEMFVEADGSPDLTDAGGSGDARVKTDDVSRPSPDEAL